MKYDTLLFFFVIIFLSAIADENFIKYTDDGIHYSYLYAFQEEWEKTFVKGNILVHLDL